MYAHSAIPPPHSTQRLIQDYQLLVLQEGEIRHVPVTIMIEAYTKIIDLQLILTLTVWWVTIVDSQGHVVGIVYQVVIS